VRRELRERQLQVLSHVLLALLVLATIVVVPMALNGSQKHLLLSALT
jgi:hypothetical protein